MAAARQRVATPKAPTRFHEHGASSRRSTLPAARAARGLLATLDRAIEPSAALDTRQALGTRRLQVRRAHRCRERIEHTGFGQAGNAHDVFDGGLSAEPAAPERLAGLDPLRIGDDPLWHVLKVLSGCDGEVDGLGGYRLNRASRPRSVLANDTGLRPQP